VGSKYGEGKDNGVKSRRRQGGGAEVREQEWMKRGRKNLGGEQRTIAQEKERK
jgi:hypothetical protein